MDSKMPENIRLSSSFIPAKREARTTYFSQDSGALKELNLFYTLNDSRTSETVASINACKSCGAFENKYNERGKCAFCFLPNSFENNITTDIVEYKTGRTAEYVSLFLVDDTEDNESIQNAIRILIDQIPTDGNIIFISFGTNINLHLKRSKYIFSGKDDYLKKKHLFDDINFIMRKEDFNFTLHNDFSAEKGSRHRRCTGTALSFAIAVLEDLKMASSIYLFTTGPCTYGFGAVANMSLREPIRSSSDIINGASNNYAPSAIKYYDSLTDHLISKNLSISVNLISLIIQDFGLYEMRNLIYRTGGVIIMAQDKDSDILNASCRKLMQSNSIEAQLENFSLSTKHKNDLKMTCKTRIITSHNVIFKGGKGPGYSINNMWLENSNIRNTTQFNFQSSTENGDGFIQIISEYTTADRERNIKITSIRLPITGGSMELFSSSALLCDIARTHFSVSNPLEEDLDLIRRVDRYLLQILRHVSTYRMLDANYVEIPEKFSKLIKFMYFFRRNELFKTEICSPDEAIYYRHLINSRSIDDLLMLACPKLIKIKPQELPSLVDLDVQELDEESIFILNSFNDILIVCSNKGESAAIDTIKEYVHKLKSARFPEPKVTETKRGGSQERILLALLNPSIEGIINTEDITLSRYTNELKRLIIDGAKR